MTSSDSVTPIPTGAFGPGLPLPKQQGFRYGAGAQFKIMRLKEAPFAPQVIDNPERSVEYWNQHIATHEQFTDERENFVIVLLNTRKNPTGFEFYSMGTVDTILVDPKSVFRMAIVGGASGIVLMHNHPSGDPTPSEADVRVTRDLIRGGQLLKIEVIDHVVIGRCSATRIKPYASLRELGYFYS